MDVMDQAVEQRTCQPLRSEDACAFHDWPVLWREPTTSLEAV